MSTVCLSTTFNAATSIKLRRVHIAFSSDRLILQFTRQADSKSSGARSFSNCYIRTLWISEASAVVAFSRRWSITVSQYVLIDSHRRQLDTLLSLWTCQTGNAFQSFLSAHCLYSTGYNNMSAMS